MDRETVFEHIAEQRRSVADLLESLSTEQWDLPSLCAGWRIREVAAHVTLAARARPIGATLGIMRARGNFNRFVAADAAARARRAPSQLVADLRAVADSRHHPPGTRPVDPLGDILVHGQDIAVPLGIDRPMPPDAAAAAADRMWTMTSFPFRARRRTQGVRLAATNADWKAGEGEPAEGPIEAILLWLSGRAVGLDRLSGPGVARLRARVA